ncbi:oligosaccharide flippase family protein [Geobacter luticola]|uniref:Oligosaccharide flippase family protein n=1 Tax=Geomobilimonas luticola TaxID=1114878 RepID=A0ABS5SI04_9BACT|nr:oligosaccharide flippase family protein [Geomobilimonas luticola]
MGKEEFGIWALVGVISSYAQLSDFGITESLIKFIAEYKAHDDTQRLNQLISTALVVYLLLSVVSCGIFIMVLPFVIEWMLSIPQVHQGKATHVFTIAIILFSINMLMGVFGSLIIGFQRMGYSNLIALTSTVITACGTVIFISHGYGLSGLIYNNAIVTVFVIVSNVFVTKRLFPRLKVNPFTYFSREILGKIFSFSWKVQVTNLTQLMVYQLDRVLLSHYIGLEAVSYYEVANRIATQARSFIASIFSPMVPAASALHATDEHEKVAALYRRSFKYMTMAAIPFSFLVIALAHPFVRTWMGTGYEVSALTMQLLMAAYMVALMTGPGAFILNGINKPQISMKSSVVAGVMNLVLCLTLVQWLGYYGIIIGILISIFVSGIYFIWNAHRNIQNLTWDMYTQSILRPFFTALCAGLALLVLDVIYPLTGYVVLSIVGILYSVAVGVAMSSGKYLDDFDRLTIMKLNPLKVIRF